MEAYRFLIPQELVVVGQFPGIFFAQDPQDLLEMSTTNFHTLRRPWTKYFI